MSALDVGFSDRTGSGGRAGSPPNQATGGGRILIFVAILVVLGIGLALRSFVSLEAGVTFAEAPPETRGVWTAEDSRYAGRAIEVSPTNVTLLVGDEGTAVVGRLIVTRELFDDRQRYLRLEYETQAGPDALEMVVQASGAMFLRNQPEIAWTLLGGSAAAPPPPPTVPVERTNGFGAGALGGLLVLLLAVGGLILWLFGRGGGGDSSGSGREASGPGGAPSIVRGVWTTPDPKLEGRSIRIAGHYSFAQFGPGPIRIGGVITSVKQWREDGDRVVSVKYKTAEGVKDLDMVIDGNGHMRVRGGRNSLWVRRSE